MSDRDSPRIIGPSGTPRHGRHWPIRRLRGGRSVGNAVRVRRVVKERRAAERGMTASVQGRPVTLLLALLPSLDQP